MGKSDATTGSANIGARKIQEVLNSPARMAKMSARNLTKAAEYRGDVETTEPLPFGIHAGVVRSGRVRVGDVVALA